MSKNMVNTHPRLLRIFAARRPRVVVWSILPLLALNTYLFVSSFSAAEVVAYTLCFLGGLLFWSLFEYVVHRWVYHIKIKNFRIKWFLDACHLHHHRDHEDHRTLNAGFALTYPMGIVIWLFVFLVSSTGIACSFFFGTLIYYVFYEHVHYYIHYRPYNRGYIARIQKYHLHHHYKNWNVNFGNTIMLWDFIFSTYDKEFRSFRIDEKMKSHFVNWK